MEQRKIIKIGIIITIVVILIFLVIKSLNIFNPVLPSPLPPPSDDQKCITNQDCLSIGVDFYCDNSKICSYKQTVNNPCDNDNNLPCVSGSNCTGGVCKTPFGGECETSNECLNIDGKKLNCYAHVGSGDDETCLYKLGYSCTKDTECGYDNAFCDTDVCKIQNGFEGCRTDEDCSVNFKCLANSAGLPSCKVQLNETCTVDNDCVDPAMVCDKASGNVCRYSTNHTCAELTDCISGNVCRAGTCQQRPACSGPNEPCSDDKWQWCCATDTDPNGKGLSCSAGKCQFPVAPCYKIGDDCNPNGEPCCDGGVCCGIGLICAKNADDCPHYP
jgi:hypothetical protein